MDSRVEPDLDPEVFGELVTVSEQTGGKMLPAVIEAFLHQECPSGLECMKTAMVAGDAKALAAATHKVRGSAAVLGASRLVAMSSDLEDRADAGHIVDAHELIDRMEAEMERMVAILEPYRHPVR